MSAHKEKGRDLGDGESEEIREEERRYQRRGRHSPPEEIGEPPSYNVLCSFISLPLHPGSGALFLSQKV